MSLIEKAIGIVKNASTLESRGILVKVIGQMVVSYGPILPLGSLCYIKKKDSKKVLAEIVGFKKELVYLVPLQESNDLSAGDIVIPAYKGLTLLLSDRLLSRVVNGIAKPIDDKGPILGDRKVSFYSDPPHPLKRKLIREPLPLGIKAIDGFITIGKGQRMGIFAGSGVGKSTLMGMIARNTKADVNVIALVGERGREVKEFILESLGNEGLKRSVVVVSTSADNPLMRIKASFTATTIAEYFRDKGLDVLLMIDSITRLAMAQREIGLSIGEPPTTKGYPPSVFALFPKLLERAGNSEKGSITGLYTVLVEGEDFEDPIADNLRSILDGHIVLKRSLANEGFYPPIDVLASLSRVMTNVVDKQHLNLAKKIRKIIATYNRMRDFIDIGAYKKGSDKEVDYAIERIEYINNFLTQDIYEKFDFKNIKIMMQNLL